jgi:hypothetical protein
MLVDLLHPLRGVLHRCFHCRLAHACTDCDSCYTLGASMASCPLSLSSAAGLVAVGQRLVLTIMQFAIG